MHVVLSLDEFSYQQIVNKQNTKPHESLLITKLLNVNGASSTTDEPTTQRRVNSFKINQSLDLGASERAQQEDDQSLADKSLSKNPKYVNKSANSADKKNSMLLRKSLSISQSNEDGTWRCPNITDNRSLECGCDVPLTLRCSGDVHGLSLIAEGLKRSKSQVSILDCTLKNVTVLSESKIFEGVSLSGLFISSGEIKRVHRLAFSGLKTPLQILGLPNNALSSVPSNSLQQLTFLDRLDLSNNEIKILSPTDFVVSFGCFTTREVIKSSRFPHPTVPAEADIPGDQRKPNLVDFTKDFPAAQESSHAEAERQQAWHVSRQPQNHRRMHQPTRFGSEIEPHQGTSDLEHFATHEKPRESQSGEEFSVERRGRSAEKLSKAGDAIVASQSDRRAGRRRFYGAQLAPETRLELQRNSCRVRGVA